MKQKLALLGSTGSIGRSVLEVVRHHPDRLEVVALAAYGKAPEALLDQAEEFGPRLVAVFEPESAELVAQRLPGVRVVAGGEGVLEAATHPQVDRVVAAMVGAAGVRPVEAALGAGKKVALANKESMVVAGSLLTRLARARGGEILPIDSEHVALHQSLRAGSASEVRRLVLTASGGPFRDRDPASWEAITPEEALQHPTWDMGAKISVDSATLMNKALELIEASHLFAVPADRIELVLHPQSIVHSLVEFCDGNWLAQLAVNDMIFPIQYALSYPQRWENRFPRLQPAEIGALEFRGVDPERFPAPGLAREALAMADSGPAVLNGANETAVAAFLERRIPFTAIVPAAAEALRAHPPSACTSIDEAMEWDRWGRRRAREILGLGSKR